MNADHRFDETRYDSRYRKRRQQTKARVDEDEDMVDEEEIVMDGEEGEEEESIDMDKVNELLGINPDDEVDAWSDESSDVKMVEDSSRRLALLNYDWSKIHAGDLMITFSSFLPENGQLKKVAVYPSDFGIQRMKQEELEGPGDIFKPSEAMKQENPQENVPKKKKGQENTKEKKPEKIKKQKETIQWTVNAEEQESALDLAKLRRYERERLKYYYAVLFFDSGKTADAVYEACNGFELEKTGIKIDLRAVPDDLKFPYEPKEVCKEKPSETSNFNFLNRALTHTSVNCTWDEPEENNARNEILFKDDFEDKIDLDDYVAPGIDEGYDPDEDEEGIEAEGLGIESAASSSEEEVEEDRPSKKLVQTSAGGSTKANSIGDGSKKTSNAFSDFDKSKKKAKGLKISFQNPLEAKLNYEDDNALGKREYRMKHVRPSNRFDEDNDDFREPRNLQDNDEDFFEENYNGDGDEELAIPVNKEEKVKLKFKERMKEKKRQAKLDKERKREELKQLKEDRLVKKDKNTQDLELIAGEDHERTLFSLNYDDPRFKHMYDDPDMALDPTSTKFKKDKHATILIEKKKRREQTH